MSIDTLAAVKRRRDGLYSMLCRWLGLAHTGRGTSRSSTDTPTPARGKFRLARLASWPSDSAHEERAFRARTTSPSGDLVGRREAKLRLRAGSGGRDVLTEDHYWWVTACGAIDVIVRRDGHGVGRLFLCFLASCRVVLDALTTASMWSWSTQSSIDCWAIHQV